MKNFLLAVALLAAAVSAAQAQTYTWSNSQAGTQIMPTQEGPYWVFVMQNGEYNGSQNLSSAITLYIHVTVSGGAGSAPSASGSMTFGLLEEAQAYASVSEVGSASASAQVLNSGDLTGTSESASQSGPGSDGYFTSYYTESATVSGSSLSWVYNNNGTWTGSAPIKTVTLSTTAAANPTLGSAEGSGYAVLTYKGFTSNTLVVSG
jgi:hypothetical protein